MDGDHLRPRGPATRDRAAGRDHATGLLIGRFQPFHLGHLHAVRYALSKADALLIGIGSSNLSMKPDNPFTADERQDMIRESLQEGERERTAVHMIPDLNNHKRWVEMIRQRLPPFEAVFTNDPVTRRLYLQREVVVYDIPLLDRPSLSGTAVRSCIASDLPWLHLVPPGTAKVIGPLRDRVLRASERRDAQSPPANHSL